MIRFIALVDVTHGAYPLKHLGIIPSLSKLASIPLAHKALPPTLDLALVHSTKTPLLLHAHVVGK
jgi:hypothetical protein